MLIMIPHRSKTSLLRGLPIILYQEGHYLVGRALSKINLLLFDTIITIIIITIVQVRSRHTQGITGLGSCQGRQAILAIPPKIG